MALTPERIKELQGYASGGQQSQPSVPNTSQPASSLPQKTAVNSGMRQYEADDNMVTRGIKSVVQDAFKIPMGMTAATYKVAGDFAAKHLGADSKIASYLSEGSKNIDYMANGFHDENDTTNGGQDGFAKTLLKDATKTLFVKPAIRTAQALAAVPVYTFGNEAQKEKYRNEIEKDVNVPLFNTKIEGQKKFGDGGVTEVTSDALKAISYLYGGGEGKAVLNELYTGKKFLNTALHSTKVGAVGGGTYAASEAIKDPNATYGSVATETLKGTGYGALAGVAIPLSVAAVTKVPRKLLRNSLVNDTEKLTEMISPKMNAKETKLAQSQGRIVPGKDATLFRRGKADTVIPSDKIIKATKTIQREIPNASKLAPSELHTALTARTTDMAEKLKPEMIKTPIKSETVQKITDDWSAIKKEQLNNAYTPNDVNVKKLQADFESRLKNSQSGNMNDLWDTAKAYDNSVPANVKNANSLSSESLQSKKEIWLQNREVLRSAINDTKNGMGKTSQNAFSDMHDMYNAKENLLSKAKIQAAQSSKIVQWAKDHPYIAGSIAGSIVTGAAAATGVQQAAIKAVTGI